MCVQIGLHRLVLDVPGLLYAIPCFMCSVESFTVDTLKGCAISYSQTRLIGERMVFIVYITESMIGHVFTELHQVLDYIKSNKPRARIEVWNKGDRRGAHWC